jgi:tetratricopeptide (TPR) repeat protein
LRGVFPKLDEVAANAARACYERGLDNYRQGDTDTAIADLSEAIRLDPTFAQAFVMRGAAQVDVSTALQDYTEAIRLKPDYVQAYYNRGFLRGSQGDYAEAINDFTQVLMRQPNHPQATNIRLDIAEWRKRVK